MELIYKAFTQVGCRPSKNLVLSYHHFLSFGQFSGNNPLKEFVGFFIR
jgi:hypothetical protein